MSLFTPLCIVPQSIYKEDLNHAWGLILFTPGLVIFLFNLIYLANPRPVRI